MRTFKAMCASAILALSLSISAYPEAKAGDQHGPDKSTNTQGHSKIPPPAPDDSGLVGTGSPVEGDISFPTLADILWALASIY